MRKMVLVHNLSGTYGLPVRFDQAADASITSNGRDEQLFEGIKSARHIVIMFVFNEHNL